MVVTKRLTKAYEVVSKFNEVPRFRTYQEELIKIYYSRLKLGKGSTIPIAHASDDQVYSVARRLFLGAHELLKGKSGEEMETVRNLSFLEIAAKKDGDVEALDERVCVQLENLSDDSDLVREYEIVKKEFPRDYLQFSLFSRSQYK